MTQPEMAYEEHARRCAEEDFWGQVRRTVGGKPFDEAQIQMIVDQCRDLLEVSEIDTFIDLCCGNGALTKRVFDGSAGGVGVDISETLIGVAKKYFQMPGVSYVESDVVDWSANTNDGRNATKALLYGSVNFLPPHRVPLLLGSLHKRFPDLNRILIGNIADRDKVQVFFKPEAYVPGIEDDPASPIGYWWSRDHFENVAREAGWDPETRLMPVGYTARHYRFDLLLQRL